MSKRRNYLVLVFVLICAAQILSGCISERTSEELPPEGEGTSGPIPIQVEPTDLPPTAAPTDLPPTAAPTEGAAIIPTDTPASSEIEDPTDTPEAVPDEPTTAPVIDETVEIQLDWDIYSVAIGESETVSVQAFNSSGNPVPFSIQSEGNCLTAAFDMESITITAGDEMCEQIITVKASNAEDKAINVIVFDPMVLDIGEGLLIRYVNDYDFVWNSRYRSFYGDEKVQFGFWHPDVYTDDDDPTSNDGWYPLGSTFAYAPWPEDVVHVPSIVVKDSKDAGLLAAPLDYVELDTVWDQGEARVWKAVCPSDPVEFVALGVIASDSSEKPSTEAMRCVRKDYTRQGLPGDHIWDTAGDNKIPFYGTYDWIIKSIAVPKYPSPEVEEGYALLPTGTSMFCQNTTRDWYQTPTCDMDSANLLVVPLPVYKHAANTRLPQLTGPVAYVSNSPRFYSAVRVPFTMITSMYPECIPWQYDGNDSLDCQRVKASIEQSPFYYILREEEYITLEAGEINNTGGSGVYTKSISVTTGFEEEHSSSFSHAVGISVEVGGDVGFLGTGGSWSVSMSYQYSWEETHSYMSSEYKTVEDTFECNPGKYCQYLQVICRFRLAHMDGSAVPGVAPFGINTNKLMILEYPPPD